MGIQSSNMLNAARLKVLKHRDDHAASVMDEAKANLVTITRDKAKYTGILQQLLTQGLCQLLEPALLIRCRQADQALVERSFLRLLLNTRQLLAKIARSKWTQRIGWEPTKLEARLAMVSQQILPSMRSKLFGANPSRKFFD